MRKARSSVFRRSSTIYSMIHVALCRGELRCNGDTATLAWIVCRAGWFRHLISVDALSPMHSLSIGEDVSTLL
jgi:hypothetical protein